MGHWNFVMNTEDRVCCRSIATTGQSDNTIARLFQQLLNKCQLHELEQPACTHENTTAHSKIDRIYMNHHVADQLDRHFSAYVLRRTRSSAHRPLLFSRRSKATDSETPIRKFFATYILRHEHWKRDLHLNYSEKLEAEKG